MQFQQSEEQLAFAEAIDDIAEGMGGTGVAREWGAGNLEPGKALWAQLAELGLAGLTTPESEGGMGGDLTDLVTVFERFGYNAVPGPYVESLAFLPHLVNAEDRAAVLNGALATAGVELVHPFALDGAAADLVFAVAGGTISKATPGAEFDSISQMRRLTRITSVGDATPVDAAAHARAFNEASLANSAMLVGAGERLLAEAVEYAKVREQFGKPIGEYQALKHQLADVRVALSFARPLLWSAALSTEQGSAHADRDVSAAKIRAAEAAELAALASLQVHGAIGYTLEHDLSLWLNWVPALVATWGTPAFHRDRVAAAVLGGAAA